MPNTPEKRTQLTFSVDLTFSGKVNSTEVADRLRCLVEDARKGGYFSDPDNDDEDASCDVSATLLQQEEQYTPLR